uniref:lysozyme n=1 Tax=Rhipicephalus pulchellus TaxID=72859 RepID=L7LVC3_RHIPC
MSPRTAAVACLALYALAIGSNAQVSDEATRKCLNCICYASTKCNTQIGCTNGGPNSYFCGPYQISYAYWVDAGKPGNFDHFEKCLKDQVCAETAVVNYMNKWGTDCDGDGQVTCYDYARLRLRANAQGRSLGLPGGVVGGRDRLLGPVPGVLRPVALSAGSRTRRRLRHQRPRCPQQQAQLGPKLRHVPPRS